MAKKLKNDTLPVDDHGLQPASGVEVELEDASQQALTQVRPRHDEDRVWPFQLVHANNWEIAEIDGNPYLLPDLTRKVDKPGSGRVRQTHSGLPDPSLRDARDLKARQTLIPRALYLRETKEKNEDGRPWYYCVDEEPRTYEDGQVLVRSNPAKWNAFRVRLLEERVIKPPNDLVIDRLRRKWNADTDRASSNMPDLRSTKKRERASLLLSQLDEAADNSRGLYEGKEAA